MTPKKWFLINKNYEIISKPLDSLEEAMELWEKLKGEYKICETIYG